MENKFFWSDLFLKFWAFAANNPIKCIILAFGFCAFVSMIYPVVLARKNEEVTIFGCNLCAIIPGILVISAMLAPEFLPSVIKISPNTPYKEELQEELRQKAMIVLRKFSISDCYSDKEDALAFLEETRED